MPKEYKYDLVFLVDDNYIDNIINQKILEVCQFAKEIKTFELPNLAINYLKENSRDAHNLPEVIFLDIRMPEIDGFAFLDALKTIPELDLSRLKIYILSSSLDPQDRKQLENHPSANYFISKPLTAEIISKL
jgi:CheY-like chemotaxis protein